MGIIPRQFALHMYAYRVAIIIVCGCGRPPPTTSHQTRHHKVVHQSIQGHGHIGLLITCPHDHVHKSTSTWPHVHIYLISSEPHVLVHMATRPCPPGHWSTSTWPQVSGWATPVFGPQTWPLDHMSTRPPKKPIFLA